MKVKSESEVAQLYLTLSNPIDCSPPGSSVHGIFQARVLEWVAIAFSCNILMTVKSRPDTSSKLESHVLSSQCLYMHLKILRYFNLSLAS